MQGQAQWQYPACGQAPDKQDPDKHAGTQHRDPAPEVDCPLSLGERAAGEAHHPCRSLLRRARFGEGGLERRVTAVAFTLGQPVPDPRVVMLCHRSASVVVAGTPSEGASAARIARMA